MVGGKVRIEFHDVSFFGDDSTDAAVAARAAGAQGKYLEYVEAVYVAAPDSGHPDLPRKKLIGFAQEAGVPDMDRFEEDLDSDDLREAVESDTATAQQLGITSVPLFLIGDQAVSGAQPIETFRTAIEAELSQAAAEQ